MNWLGHELPEWANWIARDYEDDVYAYEHRPICNRDAERWDISVSASRATQLGRESNTPVDWADSLVDLSKLRKQPAISDSVAVQPDTNYDSLRAVLQRAYEQAACGKGAERHGQDLAFEDQPMQTISALLNTDRGMLYQAIKKTQESTRMETGAAVRELLGAINYLAGAIIYLEGKQKA